MVKLLIDLRDVLGPRTPEDLDTHPDDRVVVWAPVHRTTTDLGIVTPRKRDIGLDRGVAEVEVEPGPLMVMIQSGAVADPGPWRVDIPEDEEEVYLAKVLEGAFTHTPAVIYRVGDYAMRAEKVARELEGAAYSASWGGALGDELTVMGKTSPPLKGEKGDKGDKGDKGEPGDGDVSTWQLDAALEGKADVVGGKVPVAQIPDVALTKPHTVASRSAMLALTAQEGDVAIILTGVDKGSYMLGAGSPTVFGSWHRLATKGDVESVNGKTGVVTLGPSDVGAAPATHSHTPQQVGAAPAEHGHDMDDVDGLDTALNSKAPAHQEVTDDWPTTGTPGVLYWKAEQ